MLLAGTAPDDVADTLGISRTAVHRRTAALVARLRPAREGSAERGSAPGASAAGVPPHA
jgi:hypothetical protein